MADQGKWFKLWESALDDQDLENLSIHEWFCWARFGTYLKKHGKEGKIRLRGPATAVTNLLRLPSFVDVINMLKSFPNYAVEESQNVTANVTDEIVTFSIKCLNWSKYQGDFSGDRVRKHRQHVTANVTVQEEKRRDVEEKRREETPKPPLPSALQPTATAKASGNLFAPKVLPSLKINGRPFADYEEVNDMTLEEMEEIKRRNMPQRGTVAAAHRGAVESEVVAPEPAAISGGGDDVF